MDEAVDHGGDAATSAQGPKGASLWGATRRLTADQGRRVIRSIPSGFVDIERPKSHNTLVNERIWGRGMDQVSVDEAARRMGLHPAHVRRLVREGEIPAQKVGARWLVSESALRQRERLRPSSGRPLSPNMAWALMDLAGAGLRVGEDGRAVTAARELPDRRARHRLRRLLADAPPTDRWAAWLRRRAKPERVWVHPGIEERLASDSRLHPGAEIAAAAAEVGLGAGVGAERVFYLNEPDLDAVLGDYRGRPDPDGQLVFMVIPDEVAEDLRPRPGAVSPSVALVDLLSSADARQRHRAVELLASAARRIKASSSPSRPSSCAS